MTATATDRQDYRFDFVAEDLTRAEAQHVFNIVGDILGSRTVAGGFSPVDNSPWIIRVWYHVCLIWQGGV